MKRIVTNLSRVIAIILGVFGFSVSCQEEIEIPEEYTNITQHFKQITFEAVSGEEAGSTRTIRNEDGSLSWLPNDEINVFCGQDIFGRFISNNTEIADRTTFTGHFNVDIPETSTQDYWAVYPYKSSNSSDGNSVTLSVPSNQVSSPGTFGAGMFPSVAKSSSTSLAFYNVCGSIKFSLSRGDVDRITLVSKGEEPLAGSVRVTFGSDGKPVAQAIEGISEVTLRPSSGNSFEQGKYYYMTVLPVTMSRGFTMTFHTIDGEEGTLESSNAVTIRRSASSKRDNLDTYATNWHDTESGQDFSETGVYLGILAFNQALYTCPVGLLTSESLSTYKSFIDGLQMKNGTILYYAVDNGLSNMQQGQSPKSLTNASLVTFTDGLDQGSLMMNPDYETEDKYLSAVSSRIHNGNVFGMPLTAFSIGIRGSDVQNTEKFRNNLVSLSSSEENAYEISEMSELNARFEDVAKNVVLIDYCYDLSLTIPGMPDGSRVRFTFDNVSDASSSSMFIEGTFNLRSRSLSNVMYSGLSSRSGSSVPGIENDIFVKFDFSKVRRTDGKELSLDYVKQWQSVSGGTSWQINSEFDSSSDTDIAVSVSRKSAIVYLVLDCSSSLGNQFGTMKQYAKNFIQKLYDDSYIETKVKSIKISANSASLEKGKTMKLSAMVYPATALDRNVNWSSGNTNVVTVDDSGLVTGVSPGKAYIYATSSDGGYRKSCYVTVFEQPEQPQGQSSFTQSGLYLGVMAFNQGLYQYPICRLTDRNVESICSFIDNNPVRNGSLVYYSVDEAISGITVPDYPSDLSNVALVTFTDCLDQGSLMKRSYTSNDQYLSAIKQRIGRVRVESLPLTAYSIGIRGSDVSDFSGYMANLEKLASSASNAYEITNISSLQSKLNDIADVVSVVQTYTYSYNLTVTIPGVGNGIRVRFTFDNVNNAADSQLYIEGTFNLSTRALTNIVYEGFSSTSGSTVSGSVDGIFVTYQFSGLQKSDKSELTTEYMKEWTSDDGSSSWQVNSEFNNNNDASTEVSTAISRKSAVVYLVLDFSTSLGSQSSSMKSAAKNFVRKLQEKSYDPYAVSSVSLDKTELTTTPGETIQLTATVLPETAYDKSIVWSSDNESIATVDQTGLVCTIAPGTAVITATTTDGFLTASCKVTVKQYVSSISLDKLSFEMYVGDPPVVLTATILPDNATDKSLNWTSSNPSVATVDEDGRVAAITKGIATITAAARDGSGKKATCSVTVKINLSKPDSMDAVDLGLPSKLKWASCNVGATKPEEYGEFFAWGETLPKSDYNWSTYKWCKGDRYKLTKYCWKNNSFWGGSGSPDNKTILDLEDDAAYVNWGGSWRMPTREEWKELMNNCTCIWTDNYNGTERKGLVVTSRKNGNSIFLPAANTNLGRYWSSSIGSAAPYNAHSFRFDSNTEGTLEDAYRFLGITVRPVLSYVTGISLNKTRLALEPGDSETITATVTPSYATEKSVTWSSNNTSVATVSSSGVVTAVGQGICTITATTVDGGYYAECEVAVKQETAIGQTFVAVDLGLPSGTKWASFNLGASKPEEYGDYYAWGETEPYYSSLAPLTWKEGKEAGYDWSSYKWCMGSETTLTKYCSYSEYGYNGFTDTKTILDLEDDAANVVLGGSWRMPTREEILELYSNCTWTWTDNYKGTGVKGQVGTASNGNSIFFSASGQWNGTDLKYVGFFAYYWSSEIFTRLPYDGENLSIDSDGVAGSCSYRSSGRSIRPVCHQD